MKAILFLARFAVGALFIFSGLVKINDPLGTAIKLTEYFEVFSEDIPALASLFHAMASISLPIAVFLNVLEVVLGVALLINYRAKLVLWVYLFLILFFTFLTGYSAILNKVTDCGCFGDAIPLTPWQSFYKDIILTLLIAFLFLQRNHLQHLFKEKLARVIVGGSAAIGLLLCYLAIAHLPFIDFRDYAIGNHIPTLMQPSAPFEYEYIMEDTVSGKKERFTQYPSKDNHPTLKFVDMILTNPEAEPKITDFAVWDNTGDYTDYTLEGNKLLLVIHDANKASDQHMAEIMTVLNAQEKQGTTPMVLTASVQADMEEFRHAHQVDVPYYFADHTVLKAVIRSNPGLLVLKNGKVVGKWHHNDVPSSEKINELLGNH